MKQGKPNGFIQKFLQSALYTCGERSRTTSQRYLIILEFMHFTSFFNFNTKGDDFKNKEEINGVKVRVGI